MKKLLLLMAALTCSGVAMADGAYVSIAPTSGAPGSKVTVNVALTNPDANFTPCAYQCDVTLPTGVTLANPLALSTITSQCSDHVVVSNVLSTGELRILCYSMTNAAIAKGNVAKFDVQVDAEATGSLTFTVNNIEIADKNSVSQTAGEKTSKLNVIDGDITGDGSINAADLSVLVEYVLSTTANPEGKGDLNNDGSVNAADLSALVELILK